METRKIKNLMGCGDDVNFLEIIIMNYTSLYSQGLMVLFILF